LRRCAWAVRALSHMDSSMCSSAPDLKMWIIQGTLAWRTPVWIGVWKKLLLRRIDGVIQVRSHGVIQVRSHVALGGSWRLGGAHLYGGLSLEHRLRFILNGKMEHLTTHLHRPRTTRPPLSFWGDGGIVPYEPFFFMLFPAVWRKQ
jgi:hypothetical protein